MILEYLNYDNLDVEKELRLIEKCDIANIVVDQKNKKCLFIMGMLFANGKRIRVLNENELTYDGTNKSFNMMSYVWSRLCDLTQSPCPKVDNEMNVRILFAIDNDIKVKKIENNPIKNKIFLISPVRNATPEQRKWIEDFQTQKCNDGYTIHVPHLHTNQNDILGGFGICTQNANAVASSEEVDIYYDQKSTGSVFDLGVAYALGKPLKLLNREEIVFDDEDLIDNIVKDWPFNNERKSVKIRKR